MAHLGRTTSPAAMILIALASASLLVPSTACGDCSDYENGIRWAFGQSFAQYVPGYGIEGSLSGLARDGNKVLLAGDTGTMVLIETAPDQYAYGGGFGFPAHKVAATPNRGYFAGDDFKVINTLNPDQPTVICTIPGLDLGDIAVANAHAYATSAYGLTIIDLREPAIRVTGTLDLYPRWALSVAAYGNRAYVVTSDGLKVIDVSDPSAPVLLSDAYPSNSLARVTRQGAYLYVTNSVSGLRIFSLDDPDLPHLVGSAFVPSASDIAVGGGLALVGGSYGLVTAVDVANPAAPAIKGAYGGLDLGAGVIEADGGGGARAFLAAGLMGFQVLDLGNGTAASPIGNVPEGANGRDLHAESGVLTLITSQRLRTFNVADPANPTPLGSLQLAYPQWLAVSGQTAYVEDSNGLEVIDLSVPAVPALLQTLPRNYTSRGVVSENRLYELQPGYYVYTYDITDPHAPVLLGVGPTDWVDCAVADGDWLYTGYSFEGNGALTKWDMTDPSNVHADGWGMVDNSVVGLALEPASGKLIVSAGTGIYFLDPNNLYSSQGLRDHSFGGSIALGTEGRVYIGTSEGGVRLVSYDGNPHYLGSGVSTDRSTEPPGIAEVGGYLYITGYTGLHVIAPPCGLTSVPVPAATAGSLRAAPNPFTAETSLRFDLPAPAVAGLRVYDPAGRLVRTLLPTAALSAGAHVVTWDARDEAGRTAPAGVYLARIAPVNGRQGTVRIVLR